MHQRPPAASNTYEKQTSENSGGASVHEQQKKFRLLICSPSNGGCDELTRRIKMLRHERTSALHAFENWRGHRFSIVRVGRADSIRSANDGDDVGFDAMVKSRIDQLICKKQSERSSSLMEHYKTLITAENNLRKKIQMLKSSSSVNKNDASF